MKRMLTRLFLPELLLTGLLTGCACGMVEDIVPEEARLVEVGFVKPDLGIPAVLTRAEDTEVPGPTPLPEGSTIRIVAYYRSSIGVEASPVPFSTTTPTVEATYKVMADGSLALCSVDDTGKPVDGKAEGMVDRGGVYDFYAVSPARKLAKSVDGTYKITDIPHKEDVMTSFVRGVTISASSRLVTLATFSRKCALVVFNVAPSKENVIPFTRLYATGLTISKISSSGAALIVGEDTGIPCTGGEAEDKTEVVFASEEFEPVESDADNLGLNKTKGILLPKNTEPFDVEIEVQRDDKTATLKATIDKNISFDEGKRYVFTLEVKNNESSLLMTVLDWKETIFFTDANVGAPDEPYPDPDINEGIGTSFVVASWKEIVWTDGEVGGGQ